MVFVADDAEGLLLLSDAVTYPVWVPVVRRQ